MAAVILILMGLFRFGSMIKFIPYPVTTGFTTGIAVIIASQQIKEFLGVAPHDAAGQPVPLPPEFVHKLQLIAASIDTIDWSTVGVSVGSLAVLLLMRRFWPRIPGAIVAVILASIVVHFAGMDKTLGGTVETIGSRFTQGIPKMLPMPHWPHFDWSMVRDLIPDATTIAVLAGIESLLAAVVADGMLGTRHKSDCELVAQGLANIGSVLFFGIPATGAIARTAANVKSGGRTPFAGMIHAATLLAFMIFLAPLAKLIPLPTLAAVLIMVAWNMSEIDHFRFILRAPRSDILVLLTTFGLTVFADLTVAVGVGMVLASMLFMKRMSTVSNVSAITDAMLATGADESELAEERDPMSLSKRTVPHDVEVFEINGPFFFGMADRLKDTLVGMERPPRAFILRMRRVPAMDATGLHALEELYRKCARQETTLILSGIHTQPLAVLTKAGLEKVIEAENIVADLDAALARAEQIGGHN
jgi:SulP family sulfate permease